MKDLIVPQNNSNRTQGVIGFNDDDASFKIGLAGGGTDTLTVPLGATLARFAFGAGVDVYVSLSAVTIPVAGAQGNDNSELLPTYRSVAPGQILNFLAVEDPTTVSVFFYKS